MQAKSTVWLVSTTRINAKAAPINDKEPGAPGLKSGLATQHYPVAVTYR